MTEPITITMTFRLWQAIDAVMDNKAQAAMWEFWESGGSPGDLDKPEIGPVATIAVGIREAGWRQFPNDSPFPGELVGARLSREQWEFVTAASRESLGQYAELTGRFEGRPQRDMIASAEWCRTILAAVADGLDAQGAHGRAGT